MAHAYATHREHGLVQSKHEISKLIQVTKWVCKRQHANHCLTHSRLFLLLFSVSRAARARLTDPKQRVCMCACVYRASKIVLQSRWDFSMKTKRYTKLAGGISNERTKRTNNNNKKTMPVHIIHLSIHPSYKYEMNYNKIEIIVDLSLWLKYELCVTWCVCVSTEFIRNEY